MSTRISLEALDAGTRAALFDGLVRLGDDRLILGHRLSEWCGHGPILEEDIALGNIALDCLGQATNLLRLAGEVEGRGRTEDDLAYLRNEYEFKNLQLVEQPNGDFAATLVRQFLYDAFGFLRYDRLRHSAFEPLAGVAAKAHKELAYHLRHSGEWILRLGDGTAESHARTQQALENLWTFTGEMFHVDDVDRVLAALEIVPDAAALKPEWQRLVADHLTRATLAVPSDERYMSRGSRAGRHTEHLGHLLSEMQILARSFPGAKW